MGKPKMWNISKTDEGRAKWAKILVSGQYSVHSDGTFHARFLEFGLRSFGACCKISNFTIFKTMAKRRHVIKGILASE